MPPIRDMQCSDCGHLEEVLVRYPGDEPTECSHCESQKLKSLPTAPGGYSVSGSNSGSTTPKSAGSFKRAK